MHLRTKHIAGFGRNRGGTGRTAGGGPPGPLLPSGNPSRNRRQTLLGTGRRIELGCLIGEQGLKRPTNALGKVIDGPPAPPVDKLPKFTPSWTVPEDDDHSFRAYDATGLFICSVSHREDLRSRSYRHTEPMRKQEARRIAKAFAYSAQ